ncbi:MAG: HIT family protein [Brevefilum sp.]
MDYIWTPWRMKYIQEHQPDDECIFCLAVESDDDEKHLVFYRGDHVYMLLNRYPYTSGHVMCVPYAHEARLHDLEEATRAEMMEMMTRAVQVLQPVYEPDGFNIGLNLGEMAGAGVAEHLHTHIVPRWAGDANFMTSVSATRVLPETLSETYRRVKEAWDNFS